MSKALHKCMAIIYCFPSFLLLVLPEDYIGCIVVYKYLHLSVNTFHFCTALFSTEIASPDRVFFYNNSPIIN